MPTLPVAHPSAAGHGRRAFLFPRNYLWFPIFASIAGIIGFIALRHLPIGRIQSPFSVWAWLLAAAVFFALPWQTTELPRPLANRSAAYLCLGVALRLSQVWWWHLRRHTLARAMTLAVFVSATAMQAPRHHPLSVLAIVGSLTFLASGSLPRGARWLGGPFVGTTFGVYLIHPFLVGFLQMIFVRTGFAPGPWTAVVLDLPVFILSAALVRLARHWNTPDWLLPTG